MKEYIKLAWRNIWRNKRRTLITAASVFFAVFFAIIQRGFHKGTWVNMLDAVLHSYTGYLQVHDSGYWENKTLDYTMEWPNHLEKIIKEEKQIKTIIPRLESFALASAGLKSKGVLVCGVDPTVENKFTKLDSKLKEGSFLKENDNGVVLTQRLAKFLNLKINDTLVLIGQGYQGISAAGVYPVRGIIKLPSPDLDNMMVYLTLTSAQDLYSAYGKVTSLVLDFENVKKMDVIGSNLKSKLDVRQYEVMNWKELLKELYQQYITDDVGGQILLAILYLIVGFGVFGTVLMMITERKREFGIMISVGMQKYKLAGVIGLELVFVTFLGVILGMIGSIPIIAYYHFHPIYFSGEMAEVYESYGIEPVMITLWQADYIIKQGMIILGMVLIIMTYPVYNLSKMNVINALRK